MRALLYWNHKMNSNLWPGSKKDRGKKQTTEGLLWAEIHRCGSFDIQKKKKKALERSFVYWSERSKRQGWNEKQGWRQWGRKGKWRQRRALIAGWQTKRQHCTGSETKERAGLRRHTKKWKNDACSLPRVNVSAWDETCMCACSVCMCVCGVGGLQEGGCCRYRRRTFNLHSDWAWKGSVLIMRWRPGSFNSFDPPRLPLLSPHHRKHKQPGTILALQPELRE